MRSARYTLVLLAGVLVALAPVRSRPAARAPARATANDNRLPAGVLRGGVLTIHLVAQMVAWHPEAEDGPFKVVEAFGEAGRAPSIPGPLLRIPLGTTIDASIANALPDTLVVLGVRGRDDSLRIAPGQTQRVRYRPPAAGSYLYRAGIVREGEVRFSGTHGQLVGGLIVDPGSAPPRDRVFITTGWDPNPYFLATNGKSWPYTEKFVHTVGDTVRWRVLNAGTGSAAHHPMHLHGFYYRVDARGGWDADTLYAASERRWVVTENLPGLSSMAMTWVPARPGNWLFHCHNADHIAGRHRHIIAGRTPPYPEPPMHDTREHAAWDMAGIATAITILPRPGDRVTATSPSGARALRLLVQSRPAYYGRGPGFGYVLQEGAAEPAADSVLIPGPRLVLRRGEPVAITVVNRLPTHTAVHWHGIELESYYDGMAGVSGTDDRLAPLIAPGDSFVVRFTPPRAGTFIYHAHVTDHVQIARGLYGALLVVPPDRPDTPETDHVMVVSFGRPNGKANILLNGSTAPAPIGRRRQGVQRLRVINIATENNVVLTVSADSALIAWRAVAKDGFDLPAAQRRVQPAQVRVFPGESYDFEFESPADVLTVRIKNPSAPPGEDDVSLQLRARP
jgi:manganese oxidase